MSESTGANLQNRYKILFLSHRVSHRDFRYDLETYFYPRRRVRFKGPFSSRIFEEIEEIYIEIKRLAESSQIRWDAAVFLFENIIIMLVIPYQAELTDAEGSENSISDPVMDNDNFVSAIRNFFKLTRERIGSDDIEKPASAHSILKIVDENWKNFSELFGWG